MRLGAVQTDQSPWLVVFVRRRIGVPSQLLGKYGVDIVTGLLKQHLSSARKILVEFKSDEHPSDLSGDGNDTFSRQVRCIAGRYGNGPKPKRGVLIENRLKRFTCSEIVQHHRTGMREPPKHTAPCIICGSVEM
ncbi:protein of unknown function [Nitrospira defluvii]|uniref:Uncharacterized protein n=1 Tax=Nitrospira defluvii TaxID=330214 RepID=D8PHA4_9BACT|nr:protein of unknown function [Nitrospira defluvii]